MRSQFIFKDTRQKVSKHRSKGSLIGLQVPIVCCIKFRLIESF
jgi:hypothetical protein